MSKQDRLAPFANLVSKHVVGTPTSSIWENITVKKHLGSALDYGMTAPSKSWNSSHPSRGCGETDLPKWGGAGAILLLCPKVISGVWPLPSANLIPKELWTY